MSFGANDTDILAKLNRLGFSLWLQVPSYTTASATRYMGNANSGTTETDYLFRVPVACTLTRVDMRSTAFPGAGQTFTVTIRKNVADTSMTGTISGGASQDLQITTNQVSYAAGDLCAIKVVGSAGAAASGFAINLLFQQ